MPLFAPLPAELTELTVTQPNLVWDPINTTADPRYEWGDKLHWHQPAALSLVVDSANPHGSKTLRFLGSSASANAGKKIPFSDVGLKTGDTLIASITAYGTGGTYGMSIAFYDATDTIIGTATPGQNQTYSAPGVKTFLMDGAVTVPALAVSVTIFMRRTSGTADLDIYAMWANKGSYISAVPNPGLPDTYVRRGENIVWDPFSDTTDPLIDFGMFGPWHQPAALQIVEGVTANIYGGRTLRMPGSSASTVAGKRIPLKKAGIEVGDTVSFAAIVNGTGARSLRCVFQDATRTNVGSPFVGATVATSGTSQLKTPSAPVPAGATTVLVYMSRPTGAADIDIYALWGAKNGMITATPTPSALPIQVYQDVAELRPQIAETGLCYLQDWRAFAGKWANAVAGTQGVIALLGDSWFERKSISSYLRQALQTDYGDAGPGWVDFASTDANGAYDDGWTFSSTGSWTTSDEAATSRGVSITHFSTSDVATPAAIVLASTGTINEIYLHYYKQIGGGSARIKVDADATIVIDGGAPASVLAGVWTTVDTDAAAGLGVVAITGLSNATHTLDIEATSAGSQGLILIGADLRRTGLGVRVHKAGNGGSEAADWTAVDATVWQAGLTALAPNLCVILLGTNDKTANAIPDTYASNLATLVSRIRTAMPLCDVLLLSPADSGDVKNRPTAAFDAAVRATAAAQNCAFVSGYMHLGLNANAISRGLMDPLGTGNSRHLTDDGGRVFANLLLHALRVN